MHKLAILLSFILIAGVTVPFVSPPVYAENGSLRIVDTTGSTDRELVDGSIVYVDASPGSNPTVRLRATALLPVTFSPMDLPGKPQLASGSFIWPIGTIPKDMLPATFAVTFSSKIPGGDFEEKTVLIAIETVSPKAGIALDKTGYKAGDTAVIRVTDTHANLNDLHADTVSVVMTVTNDNAVGTLQPSQTIVTLQESEEEPGVFVGRFAVPEGSKIQAAYKAYTVEALDGVAIAFDDTKHYIDDTITLTINDASKQDNGITDSTNLRISSSSNTQGVIISLNEDGSDSGTFVGTVDLASFGEGANNAVTVGDTITATYVSGLGKKLVATTEIIEPEFEFTRSQYENLEFASLKAVDKEQNVDKYARDTIEVQITSDVDPTPTTHLLIESGPDTAVFFSYQMLLVVNDPEIASVNPHAVLVQDESTITAEYLSKQAHATARISSTLGDIPPPLSGLGEGGSIPTTADIIFPDITMVDCSAYGDTDGDGLCNNWEASGYLKIPYGGTTQTFTDSCNPCPSKTKKDVYLEVDYDASIYPDTTLLRQAVDNVQDVFAVAPVTGSAGITLHYKINDAISGLPEQVNIWSDRDGNSMSSYTEIKQAKFGTTPNMSINKKYAWAQVAHYVLIIKKQAQDNGSSGLAELVGNDIIISLGSFNNSVDQQAGTIMHELGHNLGLHHGGGIETYPPVPGPPSGYNWEDDYAVNCQPNEPSVMSYIRQFTNAFNGITLDYSDATLSPQSLDITNLNEATGLAPPSGQVTIVYGIANPNYNSGDPSRYYNPNLPIGPQNPLNFPTIPVAVNVTTTDHDINWNGIGSSSETGVNRHITDIGVLGCDWANNPVPSGVPLKDFDAWDRLVLPYRIYNTASLSTGATIMTPGISERGWDDIRLQGINAIDHAILNLAESDFKAGFKPDTIKDMFHDKLVNRLPGISTTLPGPSDYNIATHILFDKPGPSKSGDVLGLEYALEGLQEIRLHMDGIRGGDPRNDLLTPDGQAKVLPILDNNIAAIATELDKPYTDNQFTIKSYKEDPGHHGVYNEYTIVGKSGTVTSATNSFSFDPDKGILALDLIGGGHNSQLELTLPVTVMSEVNHIFGLDYDNKHPQEIFNNGTHITILLENLPLNPRSIAVSGELPSLPDSVTTAPPIGEDITGNLVTDVAAGQQIVLTTTVTNNNDTPQPFVALMEVRDSSGITVFLAWQTGTLNANSQIEVGLSWTPEYADTYTIRTFVINNLANPQILSKVSESTITVS